METGTPRLEILNVADMVAREKGIEPEQVIDAMELAIQKAGRTRYGHEYDIRAEINRKTGDIQLFRCMEVVASPEEVENELVQLSLSEAQAQQKDIAVGDLLKEALPPIDFGRVAAQTARQVIHQRVREAERERQYTEYKDRVGEIINGLVKRIEYGNVILDLGRAEGFLPRNELIPREALRVGDRVRAYISEARNETSGPQIILSRTHPQFMVQLFAQEVPEIYDGHIKVMSCARDPGSRAKIAVYSSDSSVDPVGACVGMRGSRVQSVVNELQGEKVDIIPWSSNIATFVVNALAPAEISRVVVEEDDKRLEIVVPEDQLSLAIGRRGQNVRLAAQLTGWELDIVNEEDDSKRRMEQISSRSELFMSALDVDEVISRLLVTEGFTEVEEVAYIDLAELQSIEGFDEEIAAELQNRAKEYLQNRDKEFGKQCAELKVNQELLALEGLTNEMAVALGKADIKTLDDFADLATDEVVELIGPFGVNELTAQEMIMAARAHWFEGEEEAPKK
jgi:N utilization substance protein A